jgi:hypothetical protein
MIAALALVAFLGWGAVTLRDSSASAAKHTCESAHETKRRLAVEEQMDATLDEIERGNKISAELAKTQRRLNATETEYLDYAGAIAGHCPADLGLLAHTAATGASLPATPSASTDPTPGISAAALGANIATNYSRCLANTSQLSALIEWHQKGALK